MSSSLNLTESLAQERHAERYQRAPRGRRQRGRRETASETRALESTRARAGWLLVGLGLRLISSGRAGSGPAGKAAQRTRLMGQ
jgi:hypothetical protein